MDYDKKVILLKQVCDGYSILGRELCGIVRIESEDGVAKLHLSFINIKSVERGEYILFIMDGSKRLYSFSLGARPQTIVKTLLPYPQTIKGFCVGLEHLVDCLPRGVAFGKSPDCPFSSTDFNSAVAEKCLLDFKNERRKERVDQKPETKVERPTLAPNEKQNKDAQQDNDAEFCTNTLPRLDNEQDILVENFAETDDFSSKFNQFARSVYDDEAVATENYYEKDAELEKRLKTIKEWDFESCDNEDELFNMFSKEKAQEEQSSGCQPQNEKRNCAGKQFASNRPYFQSVREQIEKLFNRFSQEDCLRGFFPDSRFVKIPYAPNKYYLVGIIKENFCEKYICYGVPAKYSERPPKQLDGYCSFIPLSICDVKGNGFWMMFQDAVTGKCVFPAKIN